MKIGQWTCNNQCKSNCCSMIYLDLFTREDCQIFVDTQRIYYKKDYTDWEWVRLHKGLDVYTADDLVAVHVRADVKYFLLHNEFNHKDYVLVMDKCINLLPDNRCKAYRNRPTICKKAPCIYYTEDKVIKWFSEPMKK